MTRTNSPYFSPKRREDARLACGGKRGLVGVYGQIGHDDVVADALDLEDLLVRHGLEMREVEAQPVRCDERTGLLDMLAEHLGERALQDMRRRVVAGDECATALVDGGVHDVILVDAAARHYTVVDGQALLRALRVIDDDGAKLARDGAGISHLATHLAIERRLVEHDGDLVALVGLIDNRAIDDDVDDTCVTLVILVAHELARPMHVKDMREDIAETIPGLVVARRTRTLALRGPCSRSKPSISTPIAVLKAKLAR